MRIASRRRFELARPVAHLLGISAGLLATIPSAWSAAGGPGGYPNRPVRLVVANAPGGTTDLVARLVAPRISEEIGQTLVIDNRGGAAGLIARDIVARAAGDGYTLLMTNQSIVFAAAMHPNATSDIARDFTAIAWLGTSPNVLVSNPTLAAKNVQELVALLKSRKLIFASGGIGSSTHMAMETFLRTAEVKALHVPYKSAGPALIDVVAGNVQFMFSTLPASLPYVRSGKLRALALAGTKRSPTSPDLPTIIEGGVRGYSYETWYGFFAPAAMTPPLVQWLNGAVNRTLSDVSIRARLADSGVDPGSGTPAEFQKLFREDVARWTKAIHEAGIRPE